MKRPLYFSFVLVLIISACGGNPPAPGFNAAASDQQAIEIADHVMEAMGGRRNWDNTRHMAWNFFGRRDLVWDKHTGRVRIDVPGDTSVYLFNVNTMEGRVISHGEEVTDEEAKKELLENGRKIWINDSYWLVMPFKLKDSGVTLKYLREEATEAGAEADVLQLTFENVGVTPQNKYEVWVDKSDHLVKQWAFFREASQDSADGIWPWDNYKPYGSLLLSGDRSDDRGPKNIRVFNELPDEVYSHFEQPGI
ncbi:MAG: hypothetical protein OEX02_20805 [Cyclobacteriaceae bacterium]|nr:hypothetical protein [Cyclobacteriaceae bacterium]